MNNEIRKAHAKLVRETELQQRMRRELEQRADWGFNPNVKAIMKEQQIKIRRAQDEYNQARATAAADRAAERGDDLPSAIYTGRYQTVTSRKGRT